MSAPLRPADVCRGLLDALDASEGRRRRRKRDTRPDSIGLDIKRTLLERAVAEDPAAQDFETWLARVALEQGVADGPVRAMALDIMQDWRLAAAAAEFGGWLDEGAPSADKEPPGTARTLPVVVLAIALAVAACGEPDWREAREPVYAVDYGGAVQPDVVLEHDAPMRTIYDAPPDLALRTDSLVEPGTSADSVRARPPADTANAATPAGTDTTARTARDTTAGTARDTTARSGR